MSGTHNLTKEQKVLIDEQVADYVTQSFLAQKAHPVLPSFTSELSQVMVEEAKLLRKTLEQVLSNGYK